jgi:hypothetical protein
MGEPKELVVRRREWIAPRFLLTNPITNSAVIFRSRECMHGQPLHPPGNSSSQIVTVVNLETETALALSNVLRACALSLVAPPDEVMALPMKI